MRNNIPRVLFSHIAEKGFYLLTIDIVIKNKEGLDEWNEVNISYPDTQLPSVEDIVTGTNKLLQELYKKIG